MSLPKPAWFAGLFLFAAGAFASAPAAFSPQPERPAYLNPSALVPSPSGDQVYVALAGTNALAVVDATRNALVDTWPLPAEPTGLTISPDGATIAVSLGEAVGDVALISAADGSVLNLWAAGFSPGSPVFIKDGQQLAVLNRFTNKVSIYTVPDGRLVDEVPTAREPLTAVASLDGKTLFVGTHIPEQPATDSYVACKVDVIDLESRQRVDSLLLPNGSTGVLDSSISPDGKWVFVTHLIGHYQVPTNQLERGWMNTNALTVIDVEKRHILGTALLDDTTLGAANPWGIAITGNGQYLAVAHSGTHELSRIPLPALIEELRKAPENMPGAEGEEHGDYGLSQDLTVMVRVGRSRHKSVGDGPRELAAVGDKIFAAEYFSGQLAVYDFSPENPRAIRPEVISLGEEPEMDQIRKGELRFTDARLCFQGWQSCLSCHSSVRSDGLNWDLLNDGVGNPKQTKSLLFSHETPPVMAHGVRAKAEVAVRAGIRFIQFAEVHEVDAEALDEYLKALRPLPSPHLVNGDLSPLAIEGKKLFTSAGCIDCHDGPYFTDMKLHRVRHAEGALTKHRKFDTPTLIEIWRTAPYLYDGRTFDMAEALRLKSPGARELSDAEMEALVEYVFSL